MAPDLSLGDAEGNGLRTFRYKKIDAFTASGSAGNPAACFYLADGQNLSGLEMLDIARQHKGFVSEVVFCESIGTEPFRLTYFSSECEVDFCGHGTIACVYELIKENPALSALKEIKLQTNRKGALTVFNEMERQKTVYIGAPDPVCLDLQIAGSDVARALCVDGTEIATDFPIDFVDAGLKTLIVPISALDCEIRVLPHEAALKEFCLENGIDIVLVYSLEAEDENRIAHTRVFAPKFGYLEDPATGSGNGAFGFYMLKNGIWDGTESVSIEQGRAGTAFNEIRLMTWNGKVLFGGGATLRISGDYYY